MTSNHPNSLRRRIARIRHRRCVPSANLNYMTTANEVAITIRIRADYNYPFAVADDVWPAVAHVLGGAVIESRVVRGNCTETPLPAGIHKFHLRNCDKQPTQHYTTNWELCILEISILTSNKIEKIRRKILLNNLNKIFKNRTSVVYSNKYGRLILVKIQK